MTWRWRSHTLVRNQISDHKEVCERRKKSATLSTPSDAGDIALGVAQMSTDPILYSLGDTIAAMVTEFDLRAVEGRTLTHEG